MGKSKIPIAIIGCGYVADAYRKSFENHSDMLAIVAVHDRDPQRMEAFSRTWGDRTCHSLDALLNGSGCEIVVNLTDPHSHFDVTRAAIAAGKHVYSEKPLAMSATEALELAALAEKAGVQIAAAPAIILGEAVRTAAHAVRSGSIGKVRLVYAELDDGMIHRAAYQGWISRSGKPWPARGEFETGCTYEHAAYAIAPLVAMFGPVRRVTAFSSLLIADKRIEPPLAHQAPDFSCGCLEFDDGIVARITNSIVAPYDHRFRIVGEEGTIDIAELWDYASPVILRRPATGRIARLVERRWPWLAGRRLKPVSKPPRRSRDMPSMDFMRGVAELAAAIGEGRRCVLDAALAAHITEVTEMLQYPERFERPAAVTSTVSCIRLQEPAQS